MVGRVGRGNGAGRTEHHAHQRFFFTDVDLAAIHAGRHRDQIALLAHHFPALAILFAQHLDLAAQHEKDFLDVGMQMHRAFMAGRDDHGGKGEVAGRHGVDVGGDTRATGTDIAHLGAAVFRVEVGLELQRVPVVAPLFIARHARLHPLRETGIGRALPAGSVRIVALGLVHRVSKNINKINNLRIFQCITKPPFTGNN